MGRIHRANAGARGSEAAFGRNSDSRASGVGPPGAASSSGAGGAGGRARRIAHTTDRSIAAARAADFHKPSAGIGKNPAAAPPGTAPAVVTGERLATAGAAPFLSRPEKSR